MYVRPQVELLTSIAEGIYAASGDLYGIDEPIEDGSLSSRSGSGHAEKISEENYGEGNVQTKFMVYLDGEVSTTHLIISIAFDQDPVGGWGSCSSSGINPVECDVWGATTAFEYTVVTTYPGVSVTDVSWRAAD